MADIGQLTRAKPVRMTLDLGGGDTVNITFDSNRITPAWTERARTRAFDDQDLLSLPKSLAEAILEWDVTQDGQPFPPTADNIAVFSFPVQQRLMTELLSAAVPGEAEGNASGTISSTPSIDSTAPPATPQNGLAPSLSPTPSTSPSPT